MAPTLSQWTGQISGYYQTPNHSSSKVMLFRSTFQTSTWWFVPDCFTTSTSTVSRHWRITGSESLSFSIHILQDVLMLS
jgi:hypothetical protein